MAIVAVESGVNLPTGAYRQQLTLMVASELFVVIVNAARNADDEVKARNARVDIEVGHCAKKIGSRKSPKYNNSMGRISSQAHHWTFPCIYFIIPEFRG